MSTALLQSFRADRLHVRVCDSRAAMGSVAASAVEECAEGLLRRKETVRMIFAAAPSQNELLEDLVRSTRIDWTRVEAFHMDEYLGLPEGAEQSFGAFLSRKLFGRLPFKSVHLIDPGSDPKAECERYTALLRTAPIDIVCLGVGENGHLAFNDPPVADFGENALVKVVELDRACRVQQVNDGCFGALGDVPTHAVTLTIPALLSAESMFCVVPGETKRRAIARMLTGPVSTECPATALRNHDRALLFVDRAAAGGLSNPDGEK